MDLSGYQRAILPQISQIHADKSGIIRVNLWQKITATNYLSPREKPSITY